jgi:hypothetical protein
VLRWFDPESRRQRQARAAVLAVRRHQREARAGRAPRARLAAANAAVMRAAARSLMRAEGGDPASGWQHGRGHAAALLCFDELQVCCEALRLCLIYRFRFQRKPHTRGAGGGKTGGLLRRGETHGPAKTHAPQPANSWLDMASFIASASIHQPACAHSSVHVVLAIRTQSQGNTHTHTHTHMRAPPRHPGD